MRTKEKRNVMIRNSKKMRVQQIVRDLDLKDPQQLTLYEKEFLVRHKEKEVKEDEKK